MAFSHPSRARDACFTAVCLLTAALSIAASACARGLMSGADWVGRILPPVFTRETASFETLLYAFIAVQTALTLLFFVGYFCSLDLWRRRRPVARLWLLTAAPGLFPAVLAISNAPEELIVWLGALGATLVAAPLLVLGLERLAGWLMTALGRRARDRDWMRLAARCLKWGTRLAPADPAARRDCGMVLRTTGEPATARALLETVFEAGQRDPEMVEVLSELSLAEEDWQAAEERLEALRQLRPHDRDVIVRLAVARNRLGRFEAARDLILSIPPEGHTPPMLEELELCARALHDIQGALSAAERLALGMGYEAARDHYGSLRDAFPQSPEILWAMADLARQRRHFADETQRLEELIAIAPEHWDAHARLAGIYRDQNRPDLQFRRLQAIIDGTRTPDAETLLEYARLLAGRSDYKHGLRLMQQHALRFPEDARFPLAIARFHLALDELEAAEGAARAALDAAAARPQNGDESPLAGEARSLIRRIEKASNRRRLEAARVAAEADPNDVDKRFAFIALLAENDDAEACVRELDRLASRHPELKARIQREAIEFTAKTERPFIIYRYLSDLALQDKELERALELYTVMSARSLHPREIIGEGCERILTLKPDFLPARAMLGEFHASRAEWNEAIAALTPYFQNGGEHTEAVDRVMFQAALNTQDVAAVGEYLDRLIAHKPRDAAPALAAAEFYQAREMDALAIQALRRARSIDDNNASVYEQLRALTEKVKEARYFELRDQIERDPENVALNMEMGDILLERGEHLQAVKYYQIAARDDSLANLSQAKQALCLAHRRLFDMAEEQLDRVTLDRSGDPQSHEIKALVYAVGAIYESDNMLKQALGVYKRIFRVDAGFRDVARKIEKIGS